MSFTLHAVAGAAVSVHLFSGTASELNGIPVQMARRHTAIGTPATDDSIHHP